jgi:hypothetical protein
MQCASQDNPTEAFEKIKAQMLRGVKTQRFPGTAQTKARHSRRASCIRGA